MITTLLNEGQNQGFEQGIIYLGPEQRLTMRYNLVNPAFDLNVVTLFVSILYLHQERPTGS